MIRFIVLVLLGLHFQTLSQDTIPRFWIGFTDKSNTEFEIQNPQDYLSERALLRRSKQSIIIDSLDLPVSKIYIDSVINSGSIELWSTSKWLNGIVVKTNDTLALDSIFSFGFVNQLNQLKDNKISKLKKFNENKSEKSFIEISNSPHYPYGMCYEQLSIHEADKLQDLGFRGQGIHIAILDAGFLMVDQTFGLSHIFDDSRLLSTYDFVRKETSVYEDHYHGEAVLSIIAGNIPGSFMGSASGSSFHLLISEDVYSESLVEEYYWVSAAEYADSAGVDIINTSLGYTVFDDSTQNHTYADLSGNITPAAIGSNIAASKGILCVTSAGNSGSNSWGFISTPADADSILTVGAINSEGARADFSSFGPSSDGDVKPNVMSVGWDTYFLPPSTGEISTGNGTSFSAPMMTGMAASLWQALPNLTNMELLHLIEESSHMYADPDSLMGYGIPNMYKIYHDATGVELEEIIKSKIELIYPNPFVDDFYILYQSPIEENVQVNIFNMLGKEIFSFEINVFIGVNRIHIKKMLGISSGCYFISINNNLIKVIKG